MLNPDYRDILSAFTDHQVEFLVVGAFAMAAHGVPRATGDCEAENAARVIAALTAFGAPMEGISEADFLVPGNVLQIGVVPRRIDVLTEIDGVSFEEAWPTREVATVGDRAIPVVSRDHLLRNKLAAGRPKDLVDARNLQERKTERKRSR